MHWHKKIGADIEAVEAQIKFSQTKETDYWNTYFARFSKLKNIREILNAASLQNKQNFIKIGFGQELTYNGEIYRTAFLDPLFISKALILKTKGLLEYNKKTGISEKPPLWVNDRVRTGDPQNHNLVL